MSREGADEFDDDRLALIIELLLLLLIVEVRIVFDEIVELIVRRVDESRD